MRAALVEDFRFPPRYRETSPPVANDGEVVLQVRAAALPNLVRGQANGSHYSSATNSPLRLDTMVSAWMRRVPGSTSFLPATLLDLWLKTAWFRGP